MAKERFLYLPVGITKDDAHPEGSVTYRPMLLVNVTSLNSGSFRIPCVLDTGADCCLLPGRVAIALGLDLDSLPRSTFQGIGGEAVEACFCIVSLEIGRGISFEARVGFSLGSGRSQVGVLGQIGFFDQFNVEFRLADGFYTIEPATPSVIH